MAGVMTKGLAAEASPREDTRPDTVRGTQDPAWLETRVAQQLSGSRRPTAVPASGLFESPLCADDKPSLSEFL